MAEVDEAAVLSQAMAIAAKEALPGNWISIPTTPGVGANIF
jgi:hypothetical protein